MTFSPKINNAPIYKQIQNEDSNSQSTTDPNWQKYLNQINNKINISNNYGNPSVCLNSDFYWNNGVASPIVVNGFISEKWEIASPGGTVFTVNQYPYPANSSNMTGSTTYLNVAISSYTGAGDGSDLYIYQRQSGSEFLRRYQNNNISMSFQGVSSSPNVRLQLQMFVFFDPSSSTNKSGVSTVDSSTQFYSTTFLPPLISSETVGAGAYVEFRLAMITGTSFSAFNFDLNYIKAEMSDISSVLYVDHALERVRIDNS